MNKLNLTLAALTLAGAAAYAQDDELSISATFAWESEYVFRGVQLAETSFQPAIDLSYGGAYAGMWTMFPVQSGETVLKEFDFYAGYGAKVSDTFSVDVGATLFYYPSIRDVAPGADQSTLEAYLGGSFDTVLSPSLYAYYDFTLENFTVEASIGHTFDLSEGFTIDTGLALGYVFLEGSLGDDYFYGQVTGDLSYAFTENAKCSVGPRLSYNEEDYGGHDTNLWWGASFTAGF